MDAAFLVLIVSLTAAAAFAAVAWRSVDEQRRRSAARVAALSSAISSDSSEEIRLRPGPTNEVPVAETSFSRPLSDAPAAVPAMFGAKPGETVRSRPMIKAAAMAAMALALGAFVGFSTRGGSEAAAVADQAAAPLELIAMRHVREGETLKVSGLVRNPRGGRMVGSVAAAVLTFDRHGRNVGTTNAPLDLISLAPGDESPFVVTIPNASAVGRYRVSFRTDAGGIRHVDRRSVGGGGQTSAN
jgi:hypothetical protein